MGKNNVEREALMERRYWKSGCERERGERVRESGVVF